MGHFLCDMKLQKLNKTLYYSSSLVGFLRMIIYQNFDDTIYKFTIRPQSFINDKLYNQIKCIHFPPNITP